MGLKDKLTDELKIAMKEKNIISRSVIRLALSSIKLAEVEKGSELEDLKILSILHKEIKTREETISEAEKAERHDMIPTLKNEISVIKNFLPSEMSDDALEKLVDGIINSTNAESIKQMGLVMKETIANVEGRASNDRISKIVKNKLT